MTITGKDCVSCRSRTMLYDSQADGICSDGTGSECIGQRACYISSIYFELEMQGGFRVSKRVHQSMAHCTVSEANKLGY